MWIMRKYLADMNPVEAMEFINERFKQTRNNEEFLNFDERLSHNQKYNAQKKRFQLKALFNFIL